MAPPRQGIEWVFLDVTDTLMRVRGCVGDVYARFAARHGLPADAGAVQQRFKTAVRSVPFPDAPPRSASQQEASERAWWREVARRAYGLDPPAALPAAVRARFESCFEDLFQHFAHHEAWELLPHAEEAVRRLRAGGRHLGIVSNIDTRVETVLEGFGLRPAFEVVVLAFRWGVAKPDPRLFSRAVAEAKTTPQQCVHIGDGVQHDVAAARAAGLHAILFDPERRHPPSAAPAILHDLADLPAAVARIEATRR